MTAQRARARQLADRIRVIVAETLERRIKDPRLGFVTITEVRITGDLREASVFYTVLGSTEDLAGTAAALESARGVLRSEVGRLTGVRHTPTLEFIHDAVPENARYIEDLLQAARSHDDEVAAARVNATYAGDADPYRRDDDGDDEDDELGDEDADRSGPGSAALDRAADHAGRRPGTPTPQPPTP